MQFRLRHLAAVLVAFAPVAHADDDDFQTWQQVIAGTKLSNGAFGALEVQSRFTDDSSHLGQYLIRPSIGFTLFDQTVFSLGYAYVRTSPETGADTYENRPWQQLAFPIAAVKDTFTLSNRTRFEQRLRNDGDDVGLRLRQQIRLAVPLGSAGWQAIGWSEVFFNLNSTDWGVQSGLDRWRNFVGVNIPLRNGVVFEPGYLNQFVNRSAGDQIDHVLSATLNVSF
jgi:hypothetical protein